jgi:hypothetical protein
MEALHHIDGVGGRYTVRRAMHDDVAPIVGLIAADQIGQTRDLTPSPGVRSD